jgi:hypothetical protein
MILLAETYRPIRVFYAKQTQILDPAKFVPHFRLYLYEENQEILKESLNMQLFLIDNNTVATLQNQIFIGSDTGKA